MDIIDLARELGQKIQEDDRYLADSPTDHKLRICESKYKHMFNYMDSTAIIPSPKIVLLLAS